MLYKLFIKVVCERVEGFLNAAQSNDQAGFRPNFSCDDHLFAVTLFAEKCNEFNIPMWVATLDFKKAFDSITHFVEYHKEMECRVGSFVFRLLYPINSYASNPWYHGSISEDEAVAKLESKPGGAYLVRRSLLGSGGLALSLRVDVGSDSAIVHYCIVAFDDGTFGLNSHPNKQTFNTVEKLIAFYAKTGTRLHRQVLNGSQSVPTPPREERTRQV